MDDLQPTLGAEWRKEREEGVLVRLPVSRRLVRLRTVRPDMLLRRGKIPDILTSLVVDLIYGKATNDEIIAFLGPREQAEEAVEMMESLRVVCEAGLIEPRVVDEPIADDEIAIDDIEYADRGYIFKLVFAPAEALSRFRHKPKTDVDAVENEPIDTQQAV
jgi:hypothetical protein